jgi:predicted O-linked N-acetylglucosamine transferase (SPINDLY family)
MTQKQRSTGGPPGPAAAQAMREAAVAHQMGQLVQAEKSYRRALQLDAKFFPALLMFGILKAQQGAFVDAERLLAQAVQVSPGDADAVFNYGNVLVALDRLDEAFAAFGQALDLNPGLAQAALNRGSILIMRKRYEEALGCFDAVVAGHPNFAQAHCNRANALEQLRSFDDALASCNRALALQPDNAEFIVSRGNILFRMRRFDEALADVDRALSTHPDKAEFHENRGNILFELKRYSEAAKAYNRALELNAKLEFVEGNRLYANMLACDWANFDAESSRLIARVMAGVPVSRPFPLAVIPSSPAARLVCAKMFVAHEFPPTKPVWQDEQYRHDRLRVAYLSSDYRNHPIAYLISEVFVLHDRYRFEIVGISFGPDDKSDIRGSITKSFDAFHEVSSQSDQQIAELMKRLEIDIAVDLNNYTDLCRPGILARRPAPVQVSLLGYPATMGADFIDYAIADTFVLPADQKEFWSEQIVYMPDCYLPHDTITKRRMPVRRPSRAEVGLPEQGFVFCCFNNFFKLTPEMFRIWMNLLRQIDGSVAWFSSARETIQTNLRNEAARAGIDPNRLVFAPMLNPIEAHLARHQAADLFLDTQFYNAHTTAADALWAGLPVVTCVGPTFPARVAGSLLKAIGLPELITETLEDYEALALSLAKDPAQLARMKEKLIANRDCFPLFNTGRYTRHLEAAYIKMWEQHRSGERPKAFAVEPLG